jgi:hypothetical protein
MQRILSEWDQQHDAAKAAGNETHPLSATALREITPDSLVAGLLSWFAAPECFFRLEPPSDSDPAATLGMPLLHCSDRRQWYVCLVSFPAAEAATALQREPHNHRYILI